MSASEAQPAQEVVTPKIGVDAVVSHHMNSLASGVAKFNEILAAHLGVARLSLADERLGTLRSPLLSFKLAELTSLEQERLLALVSARQDEWTLRLFLHEYTGLAIEDHLVDRASAIFCGNDEIEARLAGRGATLLTAWAPGLIDDLRRFEPAEISVFSFGMAHKLRTDMFARLRALLEDSGRAYTVHLSNATHAAATQDDALSIFEEMRAIFPRGLYFLGELSDVAVYNQLLETTFFAAFFRDGVRANNTSIASAMEHGAVVITNLDEHSPAYLRHMDNVIDLERCSELPFDPLVLKRISVRAMETARERDWSRLVDVVRAA